MQVVKRVLNGALLLATPRFEDSRGSFSVPYESSSAAELGISSTFVQDNESFSSSVGTIRGIHLQLPPHDQGKLVRVLRGKIVDVLVDLRLDSETFGDHELIELSAKSQEQIWIPRGFGHGFCTIEPETVVYYKVDAPYQPKTERTLAWDDPFLAIEWSLGTSDPVLSEKDSTGLSFDEIVRAVEESVS